MHSRRLFGDIGTGTGMPPSNAATYQPDTAMPESLRILAAYLEWAMDEGESVALMRIGIEVRNM